MQDQQAEPAAASILKFPHTALRKKCIEVTQFDDGLAKLIDKMLQAMKLSDGIGLAANQLGDDRRVIVMDVDKLDAFEGTMPESTLMSGRFEMVNPKILSGGGKAQWKEGCLSVPGFNDDVERMSFVEVTFFDCRGVQQAIHAGGLLAACSQHEIDHLDGLLFIDRLSRLKQDIFHRKMKKLAKKGQLTIRVEEALSF